MNYNENEYGGVLRVNLGVDISSGTDFAVTLEPRRGEHKIMTDNISVGTVNVIYDNIKFYANQYLNYTIQDGDLDAAGQWRARGEAVVSSQLIKSDYVRFTVLA